MEENREVKSARDIAIVIAIILVCLVAGVLVYQNFIEDEQTEPVNDLTQYPDNTSIDYSVYQDREDLNNFYSDFGYEDVRTLGEDYTSQEAIEANCFVKIHLEKYNEELIDLFLQNVQNGITSSIRIVDTTIEGYIMITDIKYDSATANVKIVRDYTRDRYMNKNDATITYAEYEQVEVYEYNNQNYLVVHNGILDDSSFENDTTNISINI